MHLSRTYLTLLLGFGVFLLGNTPAEPTKVEGKTKELLMHFKKIEVADPGSFLDREQETANSEVAAKIDGMIDFNYLISESLKDSLAKFTPAQLRSIKRSFREVVRISAYPAASSMLKGAEVSYQSAHYREEGEGTQKKKTGIDVDVVVYDPVEDMEATLTFHWYKRSRKLMGKARTKWKVGDMSFDGESLVLDYRNQFSGIVKQKGPEALVKQIEDKLSSLSKN